MLVFGTEENMFSRAFTKRERRDPRILDIDEC